MIRNTHEFSPILKDKTTSQTNEEYVSYDVESLFTNIPLTETIYYILAEFMIAKMWNLCVVRRFLNLSY